MNFWERVNILIETNNLSRKQLAAEAGFDVSNINKGIKDNNSPSAETAVKIARILHTTVEYLVTGEDPKLLSADKKDLDTFYKHRKTIKEFALIPDQPRKPIEDIISDYGKKYSAASKSD